jgi:hypothetical protein
MNIVFDTNGGRPTTWLPLCHKWFTITEPLQFTGNDLNSALLRDPVLKLDIAAEKSAPNHFGIYHDTWYVPAKNGGYTKKSSMLLSVWSREQGMRQEFPSGKSILMQRLAPVCNLNPISIKELQYMVHVTCPPKYCLGCSHVTRKSINYMGSIVSFSTIVVAISASDDWDARDGSRHRIGNVQLRRVQHIPSSILQIIFVDYFLVMSFPIPLYSISSC